MIKEPIEKFINQDVFQDILKEHTKSKNHISNIENKFMHVKGKIESNKSETETDHVASENVLNIAKKKVKDKKHRT